MLKPTPKQYNMIKMINDVLNIKFEGETFKDASEFISKYKDKTFETINNNKNKPPTEKQLNTISMIEEVLGITFYGKTSKEAKEFISDNLDNAFAKIEEDKQNKEPTEKQLDTISLIQEKLSIDFEGETFDDARNFISEHISQLKNIN